MTYSKAHQVIIRRTTDTGKDLNLLLNYVIEWLKLLVLLLKELMERVQGFDDSRVQAFVFQRFNKSFLYLSTIHDGNIFHRRIPTNPA